MWLLDQIRSVGDFLRKAVIAVIFLIKYYGTRTRVGNRLYCRLKNRRYDTGFCATEIDFFRTTYADPDQISHKINQNSFGYQYTQMGRIETGRFPTASVQFEHYYVYTSLSERFVKGRDWSETAYYTMAFDQVDAADLGWSQIPDYEALDAFFENLDALYEQIRTDGYLDCETLLTEAETESLLESALLDPIRRHDEVFIDIGRDGELLLADGRHRVAIARILGTEDIPVRILARHREWCVFRNELLQSIDRDGAIESKHPISHPEFRHLSSRYDPEQLTAMIAERVQPKDEPIIECDPGVSGALLAALSQQGYDVSAVVADDDRMQYLDWYTEYTSCSLAIQRVSTIDETDTGGGTVLALDPVDPELVKQTIDRTDADRLLTTDRTICEGWTDDRVDTVELIP